MSLFDKWRSKSSEGDATPMTTPGDAAGPDATAGTSGGDSARTDVSDFAPRPDGEYQCDEAGLYLRFIRPLVTETDAAHGEPATGEFTDSGRFTVTRPFERAIAYTVLADDGQTLLVRRTDTGSRSTARLTFGFHADSLDPTAE